MRLIDEQDTATPFYGSRRLVVRLRALGHEVNRKHVQRLMRRMGLEAISPKPRLSAGPGHAVYPSLLRDVAIVRANQVWSTGRGMELDPFSSAHHSVTLHGNI